MTPTETRDKLLAASAGWDDETPGDADGEAAFKGLTREEAQALRAKNPLLSPWKVVAAQAAAGVVFTALWWLFAQESVKAWSALYGATAVVLPNALMAWGTTRRPVTNASAAVLSFAVWELVKILLVIAILVVVAKQVADLSWVAMLLTMMGCLKVNWLVLLTRGRNKSISDGN
ncbi:ATP synthase subunit I [Pelomonas sp. V22]|uniref:ATP synthase subunit I n=1 Tax=Pelomonas sp. V22 TaxID=2822139 RepID=UPI0024A8EB71|nr:ATP synthase subunit I [Pelomonas sp. V22]